MHTVINVTYPTLEDISRQDIIIHHTVTGVQAARGKYIEWTVSVLHMYALCNIIEQHTYLSIQQ